MEFIKTTMHDPEIYDNRENSQVTTEVRSGGAKRLLLIRYLTSTVETMCRRCHKM